MKRIPRKKVRAPKKEESADLSVVAQPAEFFKQQVGQALANQKIKPDPNTEFYLVNMLTHFMFTENFYAVGAKGEKREETLALLMGKAMTAADHGRKHHDLKRLGDVSLYTAGFFTDSLSRKVVDIDYYIGMGRTAYGSLARMGSDAFFRTVFVELAGGFHKFVDVLAEVSESARAIDPKNLLRLYETWLRTRSERAENHLKKAGIIPNRMLKPEWQ